MAITKLSTTNGAGSTIPAAGRYAAVSGGTTSTYASGGVTYQVQTFTASGTLTVSNSGLVDVLVVGAGGGGGGGTGGGGGAGGFQSITGAYLPAGSYAVTVGAGGAAGSNAAGQNGGTAGLGSGIGSIIVAAGGGNSGASAVSGRQFGNSH